MQPLSDHEQACAFRWYGGHNYHYKVVKSLRVLVNGRPVTVPVGFLCDGASGPGIDTHQEASWLVHDWLYAVHEDDTGLAMSQSEADSVLSPLRQLAVTVAESVAALFSSTAWSTSGRRGPHFLPTHSSECVYISENAFMTLELR